jgi:predicted regulator of Ras-like GTPase activity (Roadblock/LC7/MglB family)
VPIDVRKRSSARSTSTKQAPQEAQDSSSDDVDALSALASSWIAEVSRAVAPMSWQVPQRLVLRAARGTLVVVQAPRALLLVVLEGGMRPEELRLPMGIAIARMERHLRAIEPRGSEGSRAAAAAGPPGIFPSKHVATKTADPIHANSNEVPKGSGE